jgi:hypothetical protein
MNMAAIKPDVFSFRVQSNGYIYVFGVAKLDGAYDD